MYVCMLVYIYMCVCVCTYIDRKIIHIYGYRQLYHIMCMLNHSSCVLLLVTLWTDCSPPGSSVHEILQSRILEWVVMPSSRGYITLHTHYLVQARSWQTFSIRGQIVNICHKYSTTVAQKHSQKINTSMNGHGCAPGQLYLEDIPSIGCSLSMSCLASLSNKGKKKIQAIAYLI